MCAIKPFRGQMSDSFRAAVFIVLSGGFQDAYTYTCRGEVFANAQTGRCRHRNRITDSQIIELIEFHRRFSDFITFIDC